MATDAKIVSLHPGQSARGADPTDEQFRLLVSVVPDYAIYLIDPAGRVMSWNAGAERIKGYRADEIVGRDFSQFYSAEDRAAGRPQQALGHAAASGHFHGEGWRLRKDGSRFWAEVAISALRDEAGVLTGFAKVTRDMTERHLQREREQLFAATFDHAPNGICIADVTGSYLGGNASFLQMLGYTAEELRAKTIFDVTHPEDVAESRRVFHDLATGAADRIDIEKRYLRRDGRVLWVRLIAAPIVDTEGVATSVVAQVEDITALRQAAQDLHALTRRLVQAEEGERRRIARELHDRVGQSLSALNINLDIVLGRIDGPAEVRHRLEDSAALVERTLESIEGVMAELRPPLLDEYGLAAALGWYAEDFARRTGIATAVADAAGEAGAKLRPEAATALFRIAQEALNNVLKHAHARSVGIEVSAAKDSVVLAVRDDGRGFEPAAAPRGRWGMTTMRERAEAAGGYFEVQSTPGQGTVVRVRVPR